MSVKISLYNGQGKFSALTGVTNASDAGAGNLGEYIEAVVAFGSPISLSNGVVTNITSIALTAGDWDVTGLINFILTTATETGLVAAINTTSAVLPPNDEVFSGLRLTAVSTFDSIVVPRVRININSSQTAYLIARADFSAGTIAGYGKISARRIR